MKFYIEVVVIAIEVVNIKELSFTNENLDKLQQKKICNFM